MRRKPHSPLFPPFTMYLLVAEKASSKETVLDWLVTQSPQAETKEVRVEHGTVSEIDFTVSKTEKLLYVGGQMQWLNMEHEVVRSRLSA